MVIDIKLSRKKIYEYSVNLSNMFNEDDLFLPIKISYAINKNKITFQKIANDVDFYRQKVIKKYGEPSEEDSNVYNISSADLKEKAEKEFESFLEEEEPIKIYCIELDSIPDDLHISTQQLSAIMFMIDETKEVYLNE